MEVDEAAGRRQWFLDECLRIAMWELLFGSGQRTQVEALLAAGARWHDQIAASENVRSRRVSSVDAVCRTSPSNGVVSQRRIHSR